ncbi:DUF1345 domain-containing protein [Burkholderiaceae bacterium UC74_6]
MTMKLPSALRTRKRLLSSAVVGIIVALAWPSHMEPLSRALLGWNVGVWLYLALALHMMFRVTDKDLQRHAMASADGMGTVLLLAGGGAAASLVAVALEQMQVKSGIGVGEGWPHLILALVTVAGTWLFLAVEFALAYASIFHRKGHCHGLDFPGDEDTPDYLDFLYFSATVSACAQTSDVAVNSRPMRRLVLVHTVLAFAFNTGVLALSINILAGAIG